MRLDKYANPVFNETDLFNALYKGHLIDSSDITVDNSYEISKFLNIAEISLPVADLLSDTLSIADYDKLQQQQWFMPDEYYNINIYDFCISKCCTVEEENRAIEELTEFNNRNMITLLQWLIYFVDTCTADNIIWGVGRGSSVSSFVLYLIGIHRIHSIKYNLSWQEFLR
jgi:DNA polymerase III alpha subunit